jgi:hypothetical protein
VSWQLLIVGALILNAAASLVVARCLVFSPRQRWLQHALIWLVPLVGAIVYLVFVSTQAREPLAATGKFDPLYSPNDGQIPSQDEPLNICGCSGDASDGGGGSGD